MLAPAGHRTGYADAARRRHWILKVVQEHPDDDVIDNDLILVWGSQKSMITGSDLLGRLLRGIASLEARNAAQQSGVP